MALELEPTLGQAAARASHPASAPTLGAGFLRALQEQRLGATQTKATKLAPANQHPTLHSVIAQVKVQGLVLARREGLQGMLRERMPGAARLEAREQARASVPLGPEMVVGRRMLAMPPARLSGFQQAKVLEFALALQQAPALE